MNIQITDVQSFASIILSNICKVKDIVSFKIYKDKIVASNYSNDRTLVQHIEYKNESGLTTPISITLPNANKFKHMIECINQAQATFVYDGNSLQYKDADIRFKYFLTKDVEIKDVSSVVDDKCKLPTLCKFIITSESYNSIIKTSSIIQGDCRVYLNTIDGKVKGELTNKTKSNYDSMTVPISDTYDGNEIVDIGYPLEAFKIIGLSKSSICANIKEKFAIYEIFFPTAKIVYLISNFK